jgi:hypothetical protein
MVRSEDLESALRDVTDARFEYSESLRNHGVFEQLHEPILVKSLKMGLIDVLEHTDFRYLYENGVRSAFRVDAKAQLTRSQFDAAWKNIEICKLRYEYLLLQLRGPAKTSTYKPMTADAINKAEPKPWRAQEDNRQAEEIYDTADKFVTINKAVQAEYVSMEITRMMLALCKDVPESKTVETSFTAWRKSQPLGSDNWPDKATFCKWMKDAISKPITTADLIKTFSANKQLKAGLNGFHAYFNKTINEFNRLVEQGVKVSETEAKIRFATNLQPATKTGVLKLIDDDRLMHDEPFLEWMTAIQTKAVRHLSDKANNEAEVNKDAKSNKQMINLAVAEAIKQHKVQLAHAGGQLSAKKQRAALAKKNRNQKAAAAVKQKAALAKAGDGKLIVGKNGQRDIRVPANWKEVMCAKCGILHHAAKDCFHNPNTTRNVPANFKVISDEAKLEEIKQSRIAIYENA